MANYYLKKLHSIKYEAWAEAWCDVKKDMVVVCIAKVLITERECLVDDIRTKPEFRRRGYASNLIKEINHRLGLPVVPMSVTQTGKLFWESVQGD